MRDMDKATEQRDKAKEQRKADLRALMHGNTDDADIRAAMEKARATVGEFLAALQKPSANQKQVVERMGTMVAANASRIGSGSVMFAMASRNVRVLALRESKRATTSSITARAEA
jgi:hypothetical protein